MNEFEILLTNSFDKEIAEQGIRLHKVTDNSWTCPDNEQEKELCSLFIYPFNRKYFTEKDIHKIGFHKNLLVRKVKALQQMTKNLQITHSFLEYEDGTVGGYTFYFCYKIKE